MKRTLYQRIAERRADASRRGKIGAAAKARKRMSETEALRDVGGCVTDGCLGDHTIRLLAWPDEDRHYAVTVDGEHRQARTLRGVVRVLAEMVYGRIA